AVAVTVVTDVEHQDLDTGCGQRPGGAGRAGTGADHDDIDHARQRPRRPRLAAGRIRSPAAILSAVAPQTAIRPRSTAARGRGADQIPAEQQALPAEILG